jgi:ankyrin repeat protein
MKNKIRTMIRRSLRLKSRGKKSSPIRNLPSELMLYIADFLPTAADINSLSRVNKALHSLLSDYLVSFNIKHDSSRALVHAAKSNQMDLVLTFLRLGADVEARKKSWSPLSWASRNGNLRMVEVLLEAGARVDGRLYPFMLSNEYGSPLACAIINNFDDIALLLLSHTMDVNAELYHPHERPINLAAKYGRVKVVRRLLEMGADCDPAQNKNGIRPLQSVLAERNVSYHDVVQIVLLLLENNADIEAPWELFTSQHGAPCPNLLGKHHPDARIRAIFSRNQLPLMSMGASETSGPWVSLITHEEETSLRDRDTSGEDFDSSVFKIDAERRLLVLEKPFPQLKKLK